MTEVNWRPAMPDEYMTTDSTSSIEKINPPFLEGEGQIAGELKKIVELEFKGKIKASADGYKTSARRTVEYMQNNHPNLLKPQYLAKINGVYFCALYITLCKHSARNDDQLKSETLKALEVYREEIKELLVEEKSTKKEPIVPRKSTSRKAEPSVQAGNGSRVVILKDVKTGRDVNIK